VCAGVRMRFRRPSPLEEDVLDEGFGAGAVAKVPLRATGLPEKNTFIQFPQERGGVAPVGAFTTPANLAPNLGATFATASPMRVVVSPPMALRSPVISPGASPLRTPSTMCGSPPNRYPGPAMIAPGAQPVFGRCISAPTPAVDLSMQWGQYVPPQVSLPGQPLSPLAPAFQPQMPLAPMAPTRVAHAAPLLSGTKLPPGAVRGPGPVQDRPYLLPAPMLPAAAAPQAPRVLKFSYTVPGAAPGPVGVPKEDGLELKHS